jgi:glycosyltransferase involved in cell wall biosynthesis
MAVLEALSCGVPAIGTPVGVMLEVACFPPSWDKETLAEQAIAVLTEQAAFAQRREVAWQTAVTHYDLTATTNAFLKLYHSLLNLES